MLKLLSMWLVAGASPDTSFATVGVGELEDYRPRACDGQLLVHSYLNKDWYGENSSQGTLHLPVLTPSDVVAAAGFCSGCIVVIQPDADHSWRWNPDGVLLRANSLMR